MTRMNVLPLVRGLTRGRSIRSMRRRVVRGQREGERWCSHGSSTPLSDAHCHRDYLPRVALALGCPSSASFTVFRWMLSDRGGEEARHHAHISSEHNFFFSCNFRQAAGNPDPDSLKLPEVGSVDKANGMFYIINANVLQKILTQRVFMFTVRTLHQQEFYHFLSLPAHTHFIHQGWWWVIEVMFCKGKAADVRRCDERKTAEGQSQPPGAGYTPSGQRPVRHQWKLFVLCYILITNGCWNPRLLARNTSAKCSKCPPLLSARRGKLKLLSCKHRVHDKALLSSIKLSGNRGFYYFIKKKKVITTAVLFEEECFKWFGIFFVHRHQQLGLFFFCL